MSFAMKKLLFSLFTILAFVACSDDIEEAYEITFETPTTETEAINTPYGKSTVIKFTAEAAWTADVVGTRAVDWCSVSPTSGEAGEATITITTTTNNTSEERSAQVVIKSGSTEKSIEVTQKAAPKPNEIFYTSVDGKIVKPYNTDAFGAKIISNTYENGQGVITFDGNITIIGQSAFSGCSSLESITIPESVSSIGEYTFLGCSSLKAFYGKYASADNRCLIYNSKLLAFAPTGITTYTIPEGVTTIGSDVFSGCSSLISINIPNTVTNIGGSAFSGCSSLTAIAIPEGVPSIESWTFRDCSSLTTVDIPNSVTNIGELAFYRCSSLTSINIPEGVTKIRLCTFEDCI